MIAKAVKLSVILSELAFAVIIFSFIFIPGCKNPNEFRPPEDTLAPPPVPPQLISPADSFVTMTEEFNYYVDLNWTNIADAEIYLLEIEGDVYPKQVFTLDTNHLKFGILIAEMLGKYTWRVCAGSTAWEGSYTGWSQAWEFEARWRPQPPMLKLPPDGLIFYYDSLPMDIELKWNVVQDEQDYELEVYWNSMLLFQTTIQKNFFLFSVEDAAVYTWRVRACSAHWQYNTEWSEAWSFEVRPNY